MKSAGLDHYVVVIGYDDGRATFAVNDPATGRNYEISYAMFKEFHSSHLTYGNYVLCIYPKSLGG